MTPEQIKSNIENEFLEQVNAICTFYNCQQAKEPIINMLCIAYISGSLEQTKEALETLRKR